MNQITTDSVHWITPDLELLPDDGISSGLGQAAIAPGTIFTDFFL
ncbi:MAG: hypothetical protein N3E45_03175 [Oscillatoriaceae bacterium SKW80]|nr:hypothetical protein [Oscillatoriaceae bacterium SKYG93]MCX8119823.1 hypothetical protein [Oscillatoriaceae bacterium SKW80]MDW8452072.1 hypothetical protein [Oscillatoriaceae cyanobacterium SKYGB_i_bin93]